MPEIKLLALFQIDMTGMLWSLVAAVCHGLIFATLVAAAETDEYLRHEQIDFRLDMTLAITRLPLDPAHEYRITFQSHHSLQPLMDFRQHCSQLFLSECKLPVIANSQSAKVHFDRGFANNPTSKDIGWPYFFWPTPPTANERYRPKLFLYVWGDGSPLTLQSTAEFTQAIPTISTEIEEIQPLSEWLRAHSWVFLKVLAGVALFAIVVNGIVYVIQRSSPERIMRQVAQMRREMEEELKRIDELRKGL